MRITKDEHKFYFLGAKETIGLGSYQEQNFFSQPV